MRILHRAITLQRLLAGESQVTAKQQVNVSTYFTPAIYLHPCRRTSAPPDGTLRQPLSFTSLAIWYTAKGQYACGQAKPP